MIAKLNFFASALFFLSCKTIPTSELSKNSDEAHALHSFEVKPHLRHAKRLENSSGWYKVSEDELNLHSSYTGIKKGTNKKVSHLQINDAAFEMIEQAQRTIIMSAFLFDSLHSRNPKEKTIAKKFADQIIAKKEQNPNLIIAVVLDPINRTHMNRISKQIQRLIDSNIDVFYTDLASTHFPPAKKKIQSILLRRDLFSNPTSEVKNIISSTINQSVGGTQNLDPQKVLLSKYMDSGTQTIDGKPISEQMVINFSLANSSHRKVLVTDFGQTYKAIVSSANPHVKGLPTTNFAISVVGDLAKYIYNVVRHDINKSIDVSSHKNIWRSDLPENSRPEKQWVLWAKKRRYSSRNQFKRIGYNYLNEELVSLDDSGLKLPRNYSDDPSPTDPEFESELPVQLDREGIFASFVTESKIKEQILQALDHAGNDAEIRIQMLYLTDPELRQAIILKSLKVKTPIKILLDPNTKSIPKGSPNKEIAYLLQQKQVHNPELKYQIRWFHPKLAANKAKVFSIDDPENDFHFITAGSCDWTSKSTSGENMESNLSVIGSIKLNKDFANLFDRFWNNGGDKKLVFSIDQDSGTSPRNISMQDVDRVEIWERSGYSNW